MRLKRLAVLAITTAFAGLGAVSAQAQGITTMAEALECRFRWFWAGEWAELLMDATVPRANREKMEPSEEEASPTMAGVLCVSGVVCAQLSPRGGPGLRAARGS